MKLKALNMRSRQGNVCARVHKDNDIPRFWVTRAARSSPRSAAKALALVGALELVHLRMALSEPVRELCRVARGEAHASCAGKCLRGALGYLIRNRVHRRAGLLTIRTVGREDLLEALGVKVVALELEEVHEEDDCAVKDLVDV